MAIEIEIKAWVTDPETCRMSLNKLAVPKGTFIKKDVYWHNTARPNKGGQNECIDSIRIRMENGQNCISCKNKTLHKGMEVNEEHEFSVSNIAAFEFMLTKLGFLPCVEKEKSGESWRYRNMTIELTMVKNLGYFIELEILADTDDNATVTKARTALFNMLNTIGIPEKCIEDRYYTELLSDPSVPANYYKN